MNLSTAISFSRGHSVSSTFTVNQRVSAGFSLSGQIGGLPGTLSMGLDFSHSVSTSDDRSQSQNFAVWNAKPFNLGYRTIEFTVEESQHCLTVSPLAENPFYFTDRSAKATKGFYICDEPQKNPHKMRELYAQLIPSNTEGPLVNPSSPQAQYENVVLRGDAEISSLYYAFQHFSNPDPKSVLAPYTTAQQAIDYFKSFPETEPGVIVNALEFPQKKDPPTFLNMFFGGYSETFNH
jgi:hypothetical protein